VKKVFHEAKVFTKAIAAKHGPPINLFDRKNTHTPIWNKNCPS